MHKYLRAVGFSEYVKKSQVDEFFDEHLKDENLISTYLTSDMRLCGQYNIDVCNGAGISVIGEQEKNKLAEIDFYYPFLKGYDYTLIEECTIEKHSDKESYAGIIDDYRMGIALIFYLTNGNVYNSLIKKYKFTDIKIDRIFLSALSVEGRIILPVDNKEKKINEFADKSKLNMGLQFNLVINEKDLDGEPLPGRRFRGVIWLLGEIEFLTKYEELKQKK